MSRRRRGWPGSSPKTAWAHLPVLDLGGGLAIAYTDADRAPDVRAAVEVTATALAGLLVARGLPLPELILEPGRSIAGPAGMTLYTVGAIKHTAAGITYAAVDGGMADNPRPAMYGARYQAVAVDRADEEPTHTYAVAGKHCESGDVLIEAAQLPELRPGDVLALAATGAYTATMASTYNGLPRPAAVMVADGRERIVWRPRDGGRPALARAGLRLRPPPRRLRVGQ